MLSHAYATAGSYTVTVTATDDDGASATDTMTVNVSSVCPALTGLSAPSADPDGDGLCEDLNGKSQ